VAELLKVFHFSRFCAFAGKFGPIGLDLARILTVRNDFFEVLHHNRAVGVDIVKIGRTEVIFAVVGNKRRLFRRNQGLFVFVDQPRDIAVNFHSAAQILLIVVNFLRRKFGMVPGNVFVNVTVDQFAGVFLFEVFCGIKKTGDGFLQADRPALRLFLKVQNDRGLFFRRRWEAEQKKRQQYRYFKKFFHCSRLFGSLKIPRSMLLYIP